MTDPASVSPPDSETESGSRASAGLANKTEFEVRAILLGDRLDLRLLDGDDRVQRVATGPATLLLPDGAVTVLFRYGVVVFFGGSEAGRKAFLARLEDAVVAPHENTESERMAVRVAPGAREGVESDTILLQDCAVERLQLVADVLAESVVLAWYESTVARIFDRIEPFAARLEVRGRVGQGARVLLRHIGSSLLSEHKIVGRVELGDKPEILWERADLEGLYVRLEHEFEIRERDAALRRKQELISRTAETLLQMLYNRRTLRVEWYIVILIVVEIVLGLFKTF